AACGSNISASEHTEYAPSALCNAKELSIKSCPASAIPDALQLHEDCEEVSSASAREQSHNILPTEESRLEFIGDPRHFVEQAAARSRKAGASPRYTEILTGEAAADHVN